ncbi:two-partner secretion domain-containing protein [Lyngbya aestuarii]|uniref:two-partner secretion domain-containing protein n=1 Tax=Lyngbya aestuarii TaxID=118322 RepID=UPI00403E07E2
MIRLSYSSRCWQWGLASSLAGAAIVLSGSGVFAEITPDSTLGAESSVVTPVDQINDRIDGGAARGANLFHSFEEFNIEEGRGAYFFSPAGIENILSRVTGGNPSEILGTLGTFGDSNPNLFLLNPNGIIFGPNSSLDVGGSFLGTTADAIAFGENGFFSALNPQVPAQLLTVNPSALFFNQIPAGNIASSSVAPSPPGSSFLGLRVPNGESLTLLGGNVSIDGGGVGAGLNAFGGRIEIGAVAGTGQVGLNPDGSLIFPEEIERADVLFTNGVLIDVSSDNKGDIAITGRNIDIEDSILRAGIFNGLGYPDSQAGDIVLNAEAIRLDEATVFNAVFGGAIGNSGDVLITTGSLSLTKGAQLDTSLFGQGNAGDIIIDARDTVSLDGTRLIPRGEIGSVLFAEVLDGAEGNAGDITINTGSLAVTNGGAIISRTRGQGNAGNITIRARDTVLFDGTSGAGSSNASTGVVIGAEGRGGNIEITTNLLSVTNEARLNASTQGLGSAGSIIINARDRVVFNQADALSFVGQNAEGRGGNIEITTGSLALDDARLLSSTFGRGSSGNIEITTGSLALDNARLFASTFGQGSSGNLTLSVL